MNGKRLLYHVIAVLIVVLELCLKIATALKKNGRFPYYYTDKEKIARSAIFCFTQCVTRLFSDLLMLQFYCFYATVKMGRIF